MIIKYHYKLTINVWPDARPLTDQQKGTGVRNITNIFFRSVSQMLVFYEPPSIFQLIWGWTLRLCISIKLLDDTIVVGLLIILQVALQGLLQGFSKYKMFQYLVIPGGTGTSQRSITETVPLTKASFRRYQSVS